MVSSSCVVLDCCLFVPASAHPHDRLDDLAGFRRVDRLVDLVERVELHEPVEGEAPLAVEVDQHGNERVRVGLAFDDADQATSTTHEMGLVEDDFGIWPRGAENAAGATRTETFHGAA